MERGRRVRESDEDTPDASSDDEVILGKRAKERDKEKERMRKPRTPRGTRGGDGPNFVRERRVSLDRLSIPQPIFTDSDQDDDSLDSPDTKGPVTSGMNKSRMYWSETHQRWQPREEPQLPRSGSNPPPPSKTRILSQQQKQQQRHLRQASQGQSPVSPPGGGVPHHHQQQKKPVVPMLRIPSLKKINSSKVGNNSNASGCSVGVNPPHHGSGIHPNPHHTTASNNNPQPSNYPAFLSNSSSATITAASVASALMSHNHHHSEAFDPKRDRERKRIQSSPALPKIDWQHGGYATAIPGTAVRTGGPVIGGSSLSTMTMNNAPQPPPPPKVSPVPRLSSSGLAVPTNKQQRPGSGAYVRTLYLFLFPLSLFVHLYPTRLLPQFFTKPFNCVR